MKAKERKLCVGDRVRVYDSAGMFEGVVNEILTDRRPEVDVHHSDGVRGYSRLVFSEQCRRLKRKPKKAPDRYRGVMRVTGYGIPAESKVIDVVELKESEVIASQATVTKLIKDLAYEEGSLGAQIIRDALGVKSE